MNELFCAAIILFATLMLGLFVDEVAERPVAALLKRTRVWSTID